MAAVGLDGLWNAAVVSVFIHLVTGNEDMLCTFMVSQHNLCHHARRESYAMVLLQDGLNYPARVRAAQIFVVPLTSLLWWAISTL